MGNFYHKFLRSQQIPLQLLRKGIHQLFTKQLTLSRWRFNLFGSVLLVIGVGVGSYVTLTKVLLPFVYASDTTQSWNFSIAGDYTLSDSNLVEISGSSARLKVQNYTSDANTVLLLHLDESSGNPTDSSSYANTTTSSNVTYSSGKLNNAASFNGTTSNVSVDDSAALSLSQSNTIEAWTKFNSTFSSSTHDQRQIIADKGSYQLYYDNENGKITYELENNGADTWTQVAGNETNSSWDLDGQLAVHAQTYTGGVLYAGLGNGTGDAEVWSWDGSTWTKIGGDGVNSSWAAQTFESVLALSNDGTYVYAGLGVTAGDAEVWRDSISGGTWTKIGGDAVNSSWAVGTFEGVYALRYLGSTLYAGLGNSANDAEVWSWNGSSWTKIGGDSLNSGWTTNYEWVNAMTDDGTNLYVGLGSTAGDAEVWSWNGTAWTKVGGDGLSSSWNTNYETVYSLTYMSGSLYAGLGVSTTDAEVWKYTSGTWSQIGGDGLNSSWNTNYETVYSMANDGTNIYAGLGTGAGDNEVWKYNGSSWSQIGGDGLNSGINNTHTTVESLVYANSTLYAGNTSNNAGRTGEIWSWNGTSWTRISGNYVNKSWGFRGFQTVETMRKVGDYLYAGMGNSVAGNAVVFQFDGTTWTQIGGQGVNSSWSAETYEAVLSMSAYNGKLEVGLGTSANDAEVWEWNGSTWTQIGGDSLNSGWTTNYEEVDSLATYGGYLYAGLGSSANDAEVWRWNGTSWTKIGGDSINSGWTTNYEKVTSLGVYQGQLVAGLGTTAGDAEVWAWSGSAWTKIGGDTLNSSWANATFEQVDSLMPYNNKLYAGLGTSTGDAQVWEWNGTAWSQVGGDDIASSWSTGTYERVRSIVAYNGDLYAGLGNTTGDGEVWKWDGTTWSQVGGDSLKSGWSNVIEEVTSFSPYKGKLYAGIGNTQNTDASVWSYGDNGYLQSATNSFDTSWRHIAATYNGSQMKIYINGVVDATGTATLTIPDNSHSLYIGSGYAGRESGKSQGNFEGMLDEVRISDSARTSFNTTAYTSTAQTVQPTSAVMTSGIRVFDAFTTSETLNGGSVGYRLSIDGGTTWKYYSGGIWTTSASTSQTNSASTINTNIGSLSAGTGGILWQAVLSGDGSQQVQIGSVAIGGISDTTAPTVPSSTTAESSSGSGISISSGTWYNYATPAFSWSGATDTGGSGVWGYYVYFGTDNTADPQTAGSFQTGSTYSASGLSSGSTYYLRIKTRDNAQNTSTTYAPFTYKYDATGPSNPSQVTVSPAGYTATNSYTFTWLTDASDAAAGVAGYQYKTATASGSLSDWSSTITQTSVTIADAAYQSGANTFYLRTVDTAGNVSSATTATYYYSGSAPTAPRNLQVNPLVNSSANSFAFSWTQPLTFNGSASDLTYCYTVNTVPTADNCTFTSAGATSLSASAFATQPGVNTFYLSAKDSSGNISYTTYASVEFSYNGSAPGIPTNLDVSDISIKSSSNWKLALTWDVPSDRGAGISNYKIYRSTTAATCSDSFSSFTSVGSTAGTSFADANLDQQTYYYCVKACDSANNCSAVSSTDNGYPTGRYTTAAGLSSGPSVSGVTTKKAKISWGTDRESDSKVAYGTSGGSYFDSEPSNSSQVTDHAITLTNLSPGTTYYYKTKWTDEDGNTGTSAEKTFTTDAAPTVTDPKIKNAGLSTANVEFTVKGASKVKIYYGKTASFGSVKEISTSTSETTYTATLESLEDGTKYFYRINTFDSESAEYEGNTLSFETLPRPKISNVRIQQVIGTAQPTVLVTWATNTDTSSIVTYYPEGDTGSARDEVNIALTKDKHRILIRGLLPQTNYVLIAKGRDQTGNEAQSDPQKFTTSTDTRPPQISGLKVEGTNVQKSDSSEQTSQIVVSWDTDEAASSQVEFGEGTGSSYNQKTQEDLNLTFNHLVVISNLTPSKVYHLRVISKDKAGNVGNSVDTVTITPKQSDNAFDLVITNLREVFGFVGNLNK